MDKPFAIVIMVGMAIYVSLKMVDLTTIAVTVMKIIKGHGVISRFHEQLVHVTVVMDRVTWVQLLMEIIVFAIQVSLVQTAKLLFALIDVLENRVALSIIMLTVTQKYQSRGFKKNSWKPEE